jgi:hypothetical protein
VTPHMPTSTGSSLCRSMSSCGASSSTCCPAASCASATSASSPTGDALCSCRSACDYSQVLWIPPLEPHPLWTILTRPCSGSVLSAEAPCTSSNGSSPLNCCFAPRLSMSTPHEPATTASTHPRAMARTEALCLTQLRRLCRPSLTPLPTTPRDSSLDPLSLQLPCTAANSNFPNHRDLLIHIQNP